MEAHVKTVREILHSGDQFLVPFFQRQYSWTKNEWHNLYKDVVSLIESGDDAKHFLGPLVCTPFHPVPGEVTPYQLIDGQQRLTTLTLALAALRDVSRLNDLAGFADEIHEDYLVHRRREGLQRFKVVPRLEDRQSYGLAIDGNAPGVVAGTGIIGCHSFFKRAWKTPVADAGEQIARRILIALTARMSLVSITVDGENPYEIFESLNWKGLPLEEADLIRNFLFMQIPPTQQAEFHESRWRPYESRFEAVGRYEKVPPTQFYRNYLMREGRYCRNKTAYVEFKRQNIERGLTTLEQVSELQRFATFELWLERPELCEREYLRDRFSELQQLDVTTAHSLLLNLLDRHDRGYIQRDELDDCLRDIASFVIRRTICGESTRGYGRWFPEAIPTIRLRPSADLRNYWLDKGWPDDATFVARLVEFPIYQRERKKCRHLLEQLETDYGHRESVNLQDLQIEHVLPQTLENDAAGQSWRQMLGVAWKEDHARWVHTLGNLTLTGYNQSMGNNTFAAKQQAFAQSNVSLNERFGHVTRWGGSEIKERAIDLGRIISRLWPRPAGGRIYIPSVPAVGDLFTELVAPPSEPRRAPGDLKIVIHWSMLGINESDETIFETSAGRTHAAFLARLITKYDSRLAEKLQQVAVVRRFPLSPQPERTFINRKTGEPYNSERVPGTALYLCTGTSNDDKRRGVRQLISELSLPPGCFEVL